MFKCAILGCRGRARGHARAYQYVKRGQLVAICDLKEDLLQSFGDEFGIEKRYTDIHEMLDKEKPDLLHIVTAPLMRETGEPLRYPLMNIASEHEVPAAIVEKPIAVMGEDWRDVQSLAQRTQTKFVVNTQLHFHPKNLELKRDVAEGKIGEIKFIDASARSTPVDQGPHVLQLVSSYIDNARPVKVMGQVSGAGPLNSAQPSPAHAAARVIYENGLHVSVAFGTEIAPSVVEGHSNNRHKRVFVVGTEGFVHWAYDKWERSTREGGYEIGDLNYGQEDVQAQAGLTEAVFDWLEDASKVHPTHLAQSLAEFNCLLGIYQSGLTRAPVALPFEPPDGILDALKAALNG